ncbi:MAG: PepSY domain-containing protein [Terricaulis sp.]|nr:PepSY domain-containing protein [Terricaulis sp.]
MKLARAAALAHKWLALIVGVQLLFWVSSGLFFSVFPIERVRSEHRIAAQAYPAPDVALLRAPAEVAGLLPEPPLRLTYENDAAGHPVAVAEFAARAPILIDLADWRIASPLSAEAARHIAQVYVAEAPPVRDVRLITEESTEYRGLLPAWRVAFDDAEGLAVYVAADTGRVTARRSDLWRVFDALWALHIMDWRDRENFNNGLLILASFLALVVVLSGFVLAPYRFGWLRRKPRA